MKASSTNWAAASLILALGLPVFGASGAAAGLRAPLARPPAIAVWRGHERRGLAIDRRIVRRERRNEFNGQGDVGLAPDAAAASEPPSEEAPPWTVESADFCPPPAARERSLGPLIIEIGARDAATRGGLLPAIIYGDSSR